MSGVEIHSYNGKAPEGAFLDKGHPCYSATKKKKKKTSFGWSEVKTEIPITLLCSMASYSLETQLHFSPLASNDLAPKFSVSLAKHAIAIFVA